MDVPAPAGSWPSPITAADVVAGSVRIDGARFVGQEVWWSEQVAAEDGRTAILGVVVLDDAVGEPRVVLPAPWSARSRVNEYGGGAWTTAPDAALVFVEASDQRVYLLSAGSANPVALTPEAAGTRYGDLAWGPAGVLAVRERDRPDGGARRDIVLILPDTPGPEGAGEPLVVVEGSDFFAYPTPSPSGERVAWVSWDHPAMPWDETRVLVGELAATGRVDDSMVVAGGAGVSALQPEWLGDERLTVLSDRSGRWNIDVIDLDAEADTAAVAPTDSDTGGALWNLGSRWYAPLERGGYLAVRTHGRDSLVRIDEEGDAAIAAPISANTLVRDVVGDRVLVSGSGETTTMGLWLVDLADGRGGQPRLTRIRGGESPLDPAWLPIAQPIEASGPDGAVHAFLYPPTNPETGTETDGPFPTLVLVHGGPTAHVAGDASLAIAYFTTRGIAVLDVNYAGSTGYGRAYRERLAGRWGEADVADVTAAVAAAAETGIVDPARVAIKGGSAGGWTVLRALTTTSVFAAGISRYGVADLRALAADTHDFEAHYLDKLVGPLPEAEARYRELSPLSHLDGLSAPVLIEQGLDDRVVPPAQSETVRDALAAAGIPHAYLAFAGEGHGFRRSATIIASTEAELSFLGQVLGFATPDVPELPLEGAPA